MVAVKILLVTVLSFIVLTWATHVVGQQRGNCGLWELSRDKIEREYGEQRGFVGDTGTSFYEVWVNPTTGTWTLLRRDKQTMWWVCLHASGEKHLEVPHKGAERGEEPT